RSRRGTKSHPSRRSEAMHIETDITLSNLGGEIVERPFLRVVYQKGMPDQVGVNGCRVDDVIQAAIERLETFQAGPLACEENESALRSLYGAMDSLDVRRQRRRQQGVLNTMYNHSSARTEDLEADFSATGA